MKAKVQTKSEHIFFKKRTEHPTGVGLNQSTEPTERTRGRRRGFCRRHGDPSSSPRPPPSPPPPPSQGPITTLLPLLLHPRPPSGTLPVAAARSAGRRVGARVPRRTTARAAVAEQEADREGGPVRHPGPKAVQGGRGEAGGLRAAARGPAA